VSLYKRSKGSPYWWGKFKLPGRPGIQESSRTQDRDRAQEWHDKRQAALWRESKLGERPVHTWKQAVVRWNVESHKADARGDVAKFRWLDRHFADKTLPELTRDVVMTAVREKAAATTNSTGNRYLALIRAVLRRAAIEWEWLDRPPSFRMLPEPQHRIRYLTPAQVDTLFAELPAHHKALLLFALATGLRQGNVRDLQWSQVDLGRRVAWIHGDQAKAGQAIAVPLNDTAASVLREQIGKHDTSVFTYGKKQPRPLSNINTRSWRKALARAGIENFRWHDLRHTWASWLAMSGVGRLELQELGGWKNGAMVLRYAHLSADHLALSAGKLDILLQGNIRVSGDKLATVPDGDSENAANPLILAPRPGLEPGTCGLTVPVVKRKKRA
jgi:integrase